VPHEVRNDGALAYWLTFILVPRIVLHVLPVSKWLTDEDIDVFASVRVNNNDVRDEMTTAHQVVVKENAREMRQTAGYVETRRRQIES